MRYLICYDISDDHRRNSISKFLLDYGERVQFSVFEFNITEKILDTIIKGIPGRISSDSDCVRIYRLCAECAGLIQTFGRQVISEPKSVVVI
jgi:CRISPR-associated protein Cas2